MKVYENIFIGPISEKRDRSIGNTNNSSNNIIFTFPIYYYNKPVYNN